VESTTQNDNFQGVKYHKRNISNDTSDTQTWNWINQSQHQQLANCLQKQLTYNFFTPLSTTDMDTETTRSQHALLEHMAPRKSGRLPPIAMTSATNLIQLQWLKNMSKKSTSSEITKWNYSVTKSYLEKNNLHYFTFSPNSEKPIKAVICHLPWTRKQKILPTALRT
jgi:hypothetical protein